MLFRRYLLSVLFASLVGLGGVAGAEPAVVFGVEVIAVLFGAVLVPVRPIAAIPRTTTTATHPDGTGACHLAAGIARDKFFGRGG